MKLTVSPLLMACTLLLIAGCATSPAKKPASTNRPAPVAEVPQRTYQRVDTTGKTLGDFFEVGSLDKSTKTERRSGLLASAYFFVELNLADRLPLDKLGDLSKLIMNNLPEGDVVKEIVLPRFSDVISEPGKDVESDLYLFMTNTKDRSGTPLYRMESNLPIASNYSPGIYDGYEVYPKGSLSVGNIPKAWTAIFFLYPRGTSLVYSGVSLPKVGSPLVVEGDSIHSDRQFTVIGKDATQINKAIADLQDAVTAVSAHLPSETDPKRIASTQRMLKLAYLSMSLYSWLAGNATVALDSLAQAKKITLDDPKVARFDNPTQLIRVLELAYQLDKTVGDW